MEMKAVGAVNNDSLSPPSLLGFLTSPYGVNERSERVNVGWEEMTRFKHLTLHPLFPLVIAVHGSSLPLLRRLSAPYGHAARCANVVDEW